jgi:hypothetical protein
MAISPAYTQSTTIDKTKNTTAARKAVAEVSKSTENPVKYVTRSIAKRLRDEDGIEDVLREVEKAAEYSAKKAKAEKEASCIVPVFDGILNRALMTALPFRHLSDIRGSHQGEIGT